MSLLIESEYTQPSQKCRTPIRLRAVGFLFRRRRNDTPHYLATSTIQWKSLLNWRCSIHFSNCLSKNRLRSVRGSLTARLKFIRSVISFSLLMNVPQLESNLCDLTSDAKIIFTSHSRQARSNSKMRDRSSGWKKSFLLYSLAIRLVRRFFLFSRWRFLSPCFWFPVLQRQMLN